jgi:hypothetical protein
MQMMTRTSAHLCLSTSTYEKAAGHLPGGPIFRSRPSNDDANLVIALGFRRGGFP